MNKAIIILDAFLYSQERIELFKHVLTMDVVFGATAFFLNLQKCWLDWIKSFFFVFLFDRFLPF